MSVSRIPYSDLNSGASHSSQALPVEVRSLAGKAGLEAISQGYFGVLEKNTIFNVKHIEHPCHVS